jgi:uncharacterized protein
MLFRGVSSRVFVAWRTGVFRPLVSRAMLLEVARVLAYPKFRLSTERIRSLLEAGYLPFVETVEVRSRTRIVKSDPSDDEFLACAQAGKADFVVSGDAHLLALRTHGGIPIVSPAGFLEALDRLPRAGG